eukprot:scaffold22559_cov111-Cylindrotheca_fusiformis.AAC.24
MSCVIAHINLLGAHHHKGSSIIVTQCVIIALAEIKTWNSNPVPYRVKLLTSYSANPSSSPTRLSTRWGKKGTDAWIAPFCWQLNLRQHDAPTRRWTLGARIK